MRSYRKFKSKKNWRSKRVKTKTSSRIIRIEKNLLQEKTHSNFL